MSRIAGGLLLTGLALFAFGLAWSEEPPQDSFPQATAVRPTLAEARRQAEILHGTIHPTLQIVHHQYYLEDEGLRLPAATMKDVFAAVEKEQNIRLRWLAVEGLAMNTDHVAKTPFEKAAVQALLKGEDHYAQVDEGIYRYAAPITLSNHCLKCHLPDRRSTKDRVAGLIVSIPVQGN